jgi:hypothetical protein
VAPLSPPSGHQCCVHDLFISFVVAFTPVLRPQVHRAVMADFLFAIGTAGFVLALLGLIWALDRV